jgi:hypothetical protein
MDALVNQNGIPDGVITLAHLGTDHLQYEPWMQATYIMAASKKALQPKRLVGPPILPATAHAK